MLEAPSVLGYIFSYFLCSQAFQFVKADQPPENFPPTISITTGSFDNWSNEIEVQNLWIATPSNPNDVVTLANWAYANDYTLRARGHMHTWSPLTVTSANNKQNVVLIDTTINLVTMQMTTSTVPSTNAVRVQTGASMLNLLTFLEDNGFGLYGTPAPGDITVGGVLAIGGHGAGILAVGETITPGHAYGSLSNLVISFTAVVWDSTAIEYVLKTFQRSDADAKAFLVNFGRAFITEVTLMVGANYNLRCKSSTDISADDLFADPAIAGPNTKTFASFLDQSGRVETIKFPFTNYPWLKVWTISPHKPLLSRQVSDPFNYPFSDNIPEVIATLVGKIINGAWDLTPTLGQTQLTVVQAGLIATLASDIWGPSKNLLLYIKPTTLRVTTNGYAILTTRSNIQKVISIVVAYYNDLVSEYEQKSQYPLNGQMEIRATALDQPGVVTNGESPAFSAIHPINNHPEYDVAVWFDILSIPGGPYLNEAMTTFEAFVFSTFNGTYGTVRPEWSKGWAYTNDAAWSNTTVYGDFIPASFPSTSGNDGWNWAVSTLNDYDPYNIFTNAFLDAFLQPV